MALGDLTPFIGPGTMRVVIMQLATLNSKPIQATLLFVRIMNTGAVCIEGCK
jgi:hypothetical protein